MRFPDHSYLGTITIEDVGEFRVTMDRIGTVAPHPDAAGRCLCGGPWPCPDIDAPNYRPEAYARHGAAPPSEDAAPLREWIARQGDYRDGEYAEGWNAVLNAMSEHLTADELDAEELHPNAEWNKVHD